MWNIYIGVKETNCEKWSYLHSTTNKREAEAFRARYAAANPGNFFRIWKAGDNKHMIA